MTETVRALVALGPGEPSPSAVLDVPVASLGDEDVVIDIEYSTLNYKDGLALTGRPGVIREFPLIAGIDLAGRVRSSADPRFVVGDAVVLNGAGLGERRHGGLAERAVVAGDALIAIPSGLGTRTAAAIGTAGLTAMLSVLALERGGVDPDAGEVLVTGAAGGVGGVAIAILARLGYSVVASTGRLAEQGDYLRGLGAARLVDRAEFAEAGRPLQKARWAGVVDVVGGQPLATALAQISYGGVATACGLAGGADLPTSVHPFILRGVTLAGINSVDAPRGLREEAWRRLAIDLDAELLAAMVDEVSLGEASALAEPLLAGAIRGRTVVDVRR